MLRWHCTAEYAAHIMRLSRCGAGRRLVTSETSGGLIKRSISFPPEMLAWLRERGKRIERSVDWQIREAVKLLQAAEQSQKGEAA